MKTVFGVLALAAAVFSMAANVYRDKWKCFALDIGVCFIYMPLWLIPGIAILRFFPDLIYSYFPGIWMITGAVLWITPHSIMTVKAIKRKDRLDMACSIAVILAIIFFCVFIYFWDLTKNAF